MSVRGQISIEMTIVAAAVLILTGIVVGNFFAVKDETVALAIVKNATIEKIVGADEKIVVSGIEHGEIMGGVENGKISGEAEDREKENGIRIVINAKPEGIAEKYFDRAWREEIAKKIVGKTNYNKVEVSVNGN